MSSRESGLKRREEGKTSSRQMQTATQGNQQTNRSTSEGGGRDKLKNVDGDCLACMRLKKKEESIEDHTRKNEGLKGRGGGRLKHYNIDGDMPLCLRKTQRKNKDGSSSNEKNKDDKSKMVSEAKICAVIRQEREIMKKQFSKKLLLSCYKKN